MHILEKRRVLAWMVNAPASRLTVVVCHKTILAKYGGLTNVQIKGCLMARE